MEMTIDRYASPERNFHAWNIPEWKKTLLRLHDSVGKGDTCNRGPRCWQGLVVKPVNDGVAFPGELVELMAGIAGRDETDVNLVAPLPTGVTTTRGQVEHWGCAGNIHGGRFSMMEDRITLYFASFILPADEAIRSLSQRHPDFVFTLAYVNRAHARAGEMVFRAGEVLECRKEGRVSLSRWLATGGEADSFQDESEDPWKSFAIETPSQELIDWAEASGLNYCQERVTRSLRQPLVRTQMLRTVNRRMSTGSFARQMATLALGVEMTWTRKLDLDTARQESMERCWMFGSVRGVNDKCHGVKSTCNEDWNDEHLVLIHASNWMRHHGTNYDQVWNPFRNKDLHTGKILKARACHMIGDRFPKTAVANTSIAMGLRLHSTR